MQSINRSLPVEGAPPGLAAQHLAPRSLPAAALPTRPRTGLSIKLLTGEAAATASEYAAIFAVLVIALMVCVNVVGRQLGRAVQSADAKLASGSAGAFLGGPTSAGGSKGQPQSDQNKKAENARYYIRPSHKDTDNLSPNDSSASSREERQRLANDSVGKVRGIIKGTRGNPVGSKGTEN